VARALARVNLSAIERNCARLCAELRPGAQLCAVVKADAYGHGAAACARAALAGGAGWLAVAYPEEARELRDAGLRQERVLITGALSDAEIADALALGGEVAVWRAEQLSVVAAAGGGRVHVKLDSGMGRLGTRAVEQASEAARAAAASEGVELAGLMTHFATADELDDGGFFAEQLERFGNWVRPLRAEFPGALVHAANSAAMLREAESQFDMVRCGIAVYGMDPFGRDPAARGLEPALELTSYVSDVKACAPGESVGYGRRYVADADTMIGLLPLGYGDGWRRGLSNNADVIVDGRRFPLVGTVSMDSVTADLGPDREAEALRGARATLIGIQGSERITAEEVARRLDTINYEITCGLTPRVPRAYHRDGAACDAGATAGDQAAGVAGPG
jgi:alanine racemase